MKIQTKRRRFFLVIVVKRIYIPSWSWMGTHRVCTKVYFFGFEISKKDIIYPFDYKEDAEKEFSKEVSI